MTITLRLSSKKEGNNFFTFEAYRWAINSFPRPLKGKGSLDGVSDAASDKEEKSRYFSPTSGRWVKR